MANLRASFLCLLAGTMVPAAASAVSSAELYTATAYTYGRFEARVRYAAGDGVVSSFFLWKDGSERPGTFWNELDFEKLGADCHLETNAFYGNPAVVHSRRETAAPDGCADFHTYTYEWTPEYIAWLVDGVEIRRESGAAAAAYAENAAAGMQIRFNVWPGDATFGGNFSPSILPVHQYVDWVQYSSYADGAFALEWREDFDSGALPAGWLTGSWASPKNNSIHNAGNVNVLDGYLVLSLTADDAIGPAGAMPEAPGGSAGSPGAAGAAGAPPSSTAGDDGGCSVAAARSGRSGVLCTALVLGALAVLGRRRRSPQRRSLASAASS